MTRELPNCDVMYCSRDRRIIFSEPAGLVCARTLSEVLDCLRQVEESVERGLHAAGWVAYEAAPAFDAALIAHPPTDFPLVWFELFRRKDIVPTRADERGSYNVGEWRPCVDRDRYIASVHKIREYIASGDTYQVNYTFPLEASFKGDERAWFDALCAAQQANHCFFADAGRWAVLSASPELFFRLENGVLETRPMKGTRRRGLRLDDDRALAVELAASEKDRSENAMIVDLLRNDVGKISETGSVTVARLFDIERYPTVWQMTSTVTSRTRVSVPDIFAALFPCGSVTGAPKVRTMQIIRELEPHPRGIYCGAAGWWSRDSAEFNVAIRTVTIDRQRGVARYGVGGGITWDSTPDGEFDECRAKTAFLTNPATPQFDLLESLLFDGEYFLLDEHLKRMADSAEYFGFVFDREAVRKSLLDATRHFTAAEQKVRLLLSRDGSTRVEHEPLKPLGVMRVGLSREPVDERDPFLFHKTTHRRIYQNAKDSRPDCDDVILWNSLGELTETTIANIVLEIDHRFLTPPVKCGLLGGVMREHLLKTGVVREAVLTKADLTRAQSVQLINSVRRFIPCQTM